MPKPAPNSRAIVLAVTTALASTMLAGCTANVAPPASLSANKAQTALASGQTGKAIDRAEASVLAEPRNARYRAMLGAVYMEAGRFPSAAQSFADAMELGDGNGRTALSYALAQIAAGDHNEALSALNRYRSAIDASDLGLALSLAGRPEQGVHVLGNALRGGQATAKVRQNLAFSYALMGNWRAARLMAAEDVPANEVGARMAEWAQLVGPQADHLRVANLLGAPVIGDRGQPARLALSNHPSTAEMAETLISEAALPAQAGAKIANVAAAGELPPVGAVPVSVPMVRQSAPLTDAGTRPVPVSVPAATEMDDLRPSTPPRTFEKIHTPGAAPAKRVAPAKSAVKTVADVAAPAVKTAGVAKAGGDHLIQLGSFTSEKSAMRAWSIYEKRYPQLGDFERVITKARVRGKLYYRVSAGGFQRMDANSMCRTIKADSHGCIAWAANAPLPGALDRGVRMASR
ncbi:MAG: SPOR domain-containing protein [Pontixanthobacter sp.]